MVRLDPARFQAMVSRLGQSVASVRMGQHAGTMAPRARSDSERGRACWDVPRYRMRQRTAARMPHRVGRRAWRCYRAARNRPGARAGRTRTQTNPRVCIELCRRERVHVDIAPPLRLCSSAAGIRAAIAPSRIPPPDPRLGSRARRTIDRQQLRQQIEKRISARCSGIPIPPRFRRRG
jgi:hypothetical protein